MAADLCFARLLLSRTIPDEGSRLSSLLMALVQQRTLLVLEVQLLRTLLLRFTNILSTISLMSGAKRRRGTDNSTFDWQRFTVDIGALAADCARTARHHQAALGVFLLVPSNATLAVAILKKVETLRQEKSTDIAVELFKECCSLSLSCKDATVTDLDVIRRSSSALSNAQALLPFVIDFNVWTTNDPTKTAVQIVVKPQLQELVGSLVRILQSGGAIARFGPAPPRPLERRVLTELRTARKLVD
jgi:hypothetical protein